jgi:hypothetical protein
MKQLDSLPKVATHRLKADRQRAGIHMKCEVEVPNVEESRGSRPNAI